MKQIYLNCSSELQDLSSILEERYLSKQKSLSIQSQKKQGVASQQKNMRNQSKRKEETNIALNFQSNDFSFNYEENDSNCLNIKEEEGLKERFKGKLKQHTENSNKKSSLCQKYEYIYEKLKQVSQAQVIELYLETIEQGKKIMIQMVKKERQIEYLNENIKELNVNIQRKREMIKSLCLSQTNNLNAIEYHQNVCSQPEPKIVSYYQQQYNELTLYMNEYIGNANEAQEEIQRKYKLLVSETKRLTTFSQECLAAKYEAIKMSEIQKRKCNKNSKQQQELVDTIDKLESQNNILRKELEELLACLKENQNMQIELANQNRELSKQVVNLRNQIKYRSYSMNNNCSKFTSESTQSEEINRQKQELKQEIQKLRQENNQILKSKNLIQAQLKGVAQKLKVLEEDSQKLIQTIELREQTIEELKSKLYEYERNKQESTFIKEILKDEYENIVEGLEVIEATYEDQILKGTKIKKELSCFWDSKRMKMKSNNMSELHSVKMQDCKYAKSQQISDYGLELGFDHHNQDISIEDSLEIGFDSLKSQAKCIS